MQPVSSISMALRFEETGLKVRLILSGSNVYGLLTTPEHTFRLGKYVLCHSFLCKICLPFFDDYFQNIWKKKGYVFAFVSCPQQEKSLRFLGFKFCHVMSEP